ncbi:MAG: hypothetical protein AB7V13_27980 [Pseudorhodoplanes sp.]
MARIRSIHPGQWTDEAFVSCSAFARLLAIGLRNEADDQGIFEWKPITLKMRLFPADPVDISALLDELVGAGIIKRVAVSGKEYGLIRNFRRYQRPEKPNAVHPLAESDRNFVGLSSTEQQPVAEHSPTIHGKSIQRKEEGGNGVKDSEAIASDAGASAEPEILPPDRGEMPDTPGFLDRHTRPAPEPPDPRKIIFDQGLAWLSERTNKPPDRLRSYLGKLCRDHGDAMTSAAIVDAQKNNPVDPISWMERFLNGKQKSGDLGQRRSLAAAFLGADP